LTKEHAFDRLAAGLQNNTKMESMVWTKGHSTRPLKRFLALLAHYQVESVADVWRFSSSRRQPQCVQAPLRNALAKHGIAYDWIAALGGRGRPRPDSPNIVWRNASFAAMPTISPAGVGPRA